MPVTNQQNDLEHLLETIDRAVEQLNVAKSLLQSGEKGALHRLVEAASMTTYARHLAVKMAKQVLPITNRNQKT